MSKSKTKVCKKYQAISVELQPSTCRMTADDFFQSALQMKKGLCMTANPASLANKILPSQEPLIKLRQNANNEVEVLNALRISKINVLNSSITDEIRNGAAEYMSKLPDSDIAFVKDHVARNAEKKVFQDSPKNAEYTYKVVVADFSPDNKFAMNPMQVGKWFPGMYTVYPNGS